MPNMLKYLVIGFGKFLIAIVVIFGIYIVWMKWETHSLEKFCGTISIGLPISDLKKMLDDSGYRSNKVDHALKISESDYAIYIPAASTMGEQTCNIYFNKSEVTATRVQW